MKRNIFLSLITLFSFFLLANSCVSTPSYGTLKAYTLQALRTKSRAQNWFPIHKNPKVGDFAEYQATDGSIARTEILSVKGNLYEIATIYVSMSNVKPVVEQVLKDLVISCFIDSAGYCKEAYVLDRSTNQKYPLKIAGPGDPFYIDNPQLVVTDKVFEETISTPIGEKKVSQVMVTSANLYASGVSMKMTATYLMHPDVKFQVVRYRFVNAMKVAPVTIVRTLHNYAPGDPAQKWIVDMILGKLENHEYAGGSDLLRTN